ncbi:uncharacterized protein [Panulirus ornatus]|uniref:uncharacterized protein n=1 Tax=Panulirus ornatus TaxID=150431 RepID=UPI003A8C5FA6
MPVWSGPVIFPELRGSGTTTIDQTVNIRNPLEGSSANQSLEEYVAAVSELQTEVQLLKDALPTVLYHSGQQAITGFISAASLTVDNAHFDELTLHKVNGHSLDSITREFLLDAVDQNVQESWRANYMEVDVFTTRGSPIAGTISGVLTSGEWPLARQHNSGVPARWCRSECTGKLACKLHGSGCLHHPWQSHSRLMTLGSCWWLMTMILKTFLTHTL